MKRSSLSKDHQLLDEKPADKLKEAHVFNNQEPYTQQLTIVKPALIISDVDSIEVTDEPLISDFPLKYSEELTIKRKGKKWLVFLTALVLLASSAELVIFIRTMVEEMDWLAGVWLVVFSCLGAMVLRQGFVEFSGLKQLKRQNVIRSDSEKMGSSSVIGLAEQHCLKIAKTLPTDYQYLVGNWRDNVEAHHTDSEVLSLFELQVLAPIDKLALKQVSKNASAASVMIAVSPFALLDMLIVLWRNLRMMNQVSEIYGLHLGYWGRVKLIRKIFHTMLYAGAAEILSDAGNYALSAGITGKLSTRVAQGMGAGVLTARIGLKAINESRPLPWLSQKKPGLSGITKQLLTDLNSQLK
jgi:putative membrane protein